MAYEDLRPSKILTREAFLNAIRLSTPRSAARPTRSRTSSPWRAMPASRSAPADWMEHGYDVPLLVNMQPAGKYLSERFHRAGGVPGGDVGAARRPASSTARR